MGHNVNDVSTYLHSSYKLRTALSFLQAKSFPNQLMSVSQELVKVRSMAAALASDKATIEAAAVTAKVGRRSERCNACPL